jgi:hypothetical protein
MYVTLGERCGATQFTRLAFHVQILKLLAFLGLASLVASLHTFDGFFGCWDV